MVRSANRAVCALAKISIAGFAIALAGCGLMTSAPREGTRKAALGDDLLAGTPIPASRLEPPTAPNAAFLASLEFPDAAWIVHPALVAGWNASELVVYDPESLRNVRRIPRTSVAVDLAHLRSWSVSKDGARVALLVASPDGDVRTAWVVPTETFAADRPIAEGQINGLALSADGARLATWSGRTVSVWNVAQRQVEREIEPANVTPFSTTISAGAFSPDGTRLATGASDGFMFVWKTSDWTLAWRHILRDQGRIAAMQFGPDSATLGTISNGTDGGNRTRLWRSTDGSLLANHSPDAVADHPDSMAFSPSGEILALGTRDVRLVTSPTGQFLTNRRQLRVGYPVLQLAFVAGGRLLLGVEPSGRLHVVAVGAGPAANANANTVVSNRAGS